MMEKYNINQTTLKILWLYAGNYRRTLHLRGIARETNIDVKAIQLQLKRLEKINVLSSSLKGRNKEYYLNLSNLLTKYYMILAEAFASISHLEKNFPIKRLIAEIGNQIEGTIILFGSFAKGEMTEESDVDLFVLTEKKFDTSIIGAAGTLINREVSVKTLSKKEFLEGLMTNDPLMMEVTLNHIVLKGIDDFCDVMWRYYAR